MERFLPPSEQEIRESIAKKLRQRASEACYWKEDFEDKAKVADTIQMQHYNLESAIRLAEFENLWNEAADIALNIRKE